MKKSSKILTRKVLCGLLAAGVVGMCGSAMAATEIDYSKGWSSSSNKTINDAEFVINSARPISFEVQASSKTAKWNINSNNLTINSNPARANNSGDVIGVNVWGATVNAGNQDTKSIAITVNDTLATNSTIGLDVEKKNSFTAHANFSASEVNIDVTGNGKSVIGIWAQNNNDSVVPSEDADVTDVIINADKTTINVKNNNSSGKAVGIAAYSGSRVVINSDLEVNADKVISTRGNAVTKINADGTHTVKLNGDIDFNVTNDGKSGKKADAVVDINLSNADSFLKGNINKSLVGDDTGVNMDVSGMTLSVANNAQWTTDADSFVNDLKLADGGTVNITNTSENGQKVDVGNLTGDGGVVTTNNLANKMNISNSSAKDLTVKGSGDIADAIAADARNAQKLADVVTTGTGESAKSAASKITTEEGIISGIFSADIDDKGNVVTSTATTSTNTSNEAISNMGSISLMTWRQENNDMNKRLGELRDSKGEHGAWARMARGESKYGAQNVKNQYNYYQVGYDEKLSTNPNWTVGVALTRTEGNSTFANGSGENKHTGFAVYGSYLNDNGSFIDLIAKYARLDNEFSANGGVGSGDYKNNGYSLSAEYGKRFTNESGTWIEPQVELTYGKVSSADYLTSESAKVHQDSMDSLVARLGFALGKDIKAGNIYARASYLYDFDGETDVSMSKGGAASSFSQDLGGGWWEVGVGTNINLSDATHLYFDVEKTFGGNVATPWQWNAGVRWSF